MLLLAAVVRTGDEFGHDHTTATCEVGRVTARRFLQAGGFGSFPVGRYMGPVAPWTERGKTSAGAGASAPRRGHGVRHHVPQAPNRPIKPLQQTDGGDPNRGTDEEHRT